jgi:hypothetical protein
MQKNKDLQQGDYPESSCGQVKARFGSRREALKGAGMKRMLLAVVLSLVASDALAISRYDIENMTCAAVQAVLEADGEAILRYPSKSLLSLPIYDRFVSSKKYCAVDEVLKRTGVPTADKDYCPVHKCAESRLFVAR